MVEECSISGLFDVALPHDTAGAFATKTSKITLEHHTLRWLTSNELVSQSWPRYRQLATLLPPL